MNRQNESSAEATTENIENKLDPNTPEILESKREKNSKEHCLLYTSDAADE